MTWSIEYKNKIYQRYNLRNTNLTSDINNVLQGREMPEEDQVAIGGGRQMNMAILFLDICNFTSWPSKSYEEQKKVLALMNLFMVEMISIVRDFDGKFEKNTGDGLMAYFGGDKKTTSQKVEDAIEAAMTMHYFNKNILNPPLRQQNLLTVKFRIGIDYGPVTICKIGVPKNNSLVAIGTTANIACKLLEFGQDGETIIGNDVRKNINSVYQSYCQYINQSSGYIQGPNALPYTIYKYDGIWKEPSY